MKTKNTNDGFVHLHLHSEFSFLDGSAKLKSIVERASKLGFKAIAETEHGNIFGWWRFQKYCDEFNVKPIFGVECYVANDRTRRGVTKEELDQINAENPAGMRRQAKNDFIEEHGIRKREHVVVLAKNNNGLKGIIRLVEESYRTGFYYKPRIDESILFPLAGDVVILSACLQGVVAAAVKNGGVRAGLRVAKRYAKVFKRDFYLEIQPNEIPEQSELNAAILEIHRRTKIPVVVTNDVHYIRKEDFETHDVLMVCRHNADKEFSKSVTVEDEDRFRYDTNRLFLMSERVVRKSFAKFHPEVPADVVSVAIKNSVRIADRCNARIEKLSHPLPDIEVPAKWKGDKKKYFESLVHRGWQRHKLDSLPIEVRRDYKQRVEYELEQLYRADVFVDYFLIVWDLIRWCREQNIRVGPGRGSAAGSLVSYLLRITEVDPVKWKLMFERFMSPARIDLPDIDLDFQKDRREEVKEYLREKYGADNVATICAFGSMQPRLVLKDVGRAFGVDWREVNRITDFVLPKHMRVELGLETLKEIFEEYEECKRFAKKYPDVVRHAFNLEGNIKQLGTGAAGMVVSPVPVRDVVPVIWQKGEMVTGFDKDDCEELGLLKLDVLGLNTLSILSRAVDLIYKRQGVDVEEILIDGDFDDEKIYEELGAGNTTGIFQFDTPGARRVLKDLQPKTFEHILVAAALDRPGPLTSGITQTFIKRRHGKEEVESIDPRIDDALGETYGVMIYQEQLVRIAHDVGGLSWGDADGIRKAVGKKKPELLRSFKEKFIDGAIKNGLKKNVAAKLWNEMEKFGGYGFNKSHSAAYGLIAYQTALLRTHYPLEFMCAALEFENDKENYPRLIRESKRLGISLLQPDVNESQKSFSISDAAENTLRVGLTNVDGIGEKAADAIIAARPYKSFIDFLRRVNKRQCNKSVIAALIRVGAFESIKSNQRELEENLENALIYIRAIETSKRRAEKTGDVRDAEETALLVWKRNSDAPDRDEILSEREELLNFPIEEHSVSRFEYIDELKFDRFRRLEEFDEIYSDEILEQYDNGDFMKESFRKIMTFVCSIPKVGKMKSKEQVEGFQGGVVRCSIEDNTDSATLILNERLYDSLGGREIENANHLFAVKAHALSSYKLNACEIIDLNKMSERDPKSFEPNSLEYFLFADPLRELQPRLVQKGITPIKKFAYTKRLLAATIAGRICFVRRFQSRNGNEIIRFAIEDFESSCEVLVWTKKIPFYESIIQPGNFIVARLQKMRGKRIGIVFQLSDDDSRKGVASIYPIAELFKVD